MLIAYDEQGLICEATNALRAKKYFCPNCKIKLTLKKGTIIAHHFAHPKHTDCPGGGEGIQHDEMKLAIREILTALSLIAQSSITVDFEQTFFHLGERHRADTICTLQTTDAPLKLVFECQFSKINPSEIDERTIGFTKNNLSVCWAFDYDKFTSTKSAKHKMIIHDNTILLTNYFKEIIKHVPIFLVQRKLNKLFILQNKVDNYIFDFEEYYFEEVTNLNVILAKKIVDLRPFRCLKCNNNVDNSIKIVYNEKFYQDKLWWSARRFTDIDYFYLCADCDEKASSTIQTHEFKEECSYYQDHPCVSCKGIDYTHSYKDFEILCDNCKYWLKYYYYQSREDQLAILGNMLFDIPLLQTQDCSKCGREFHTHRNIFFNQDLKEGINLGVEVPDEGREIPVELLPYFPTNAKYKVVEKDPDFVKKWTLKNIFEKAAGIQVTKVSPINISRGFTYNTYYVIKWDDHTVFIDHATNNNVLILYTEYWSDEPDPRKFFCYKGPKKGEILLTTLDFKDKYIIPFAGLVDLLVELDNKMKGLFIHD